MARLPEISRIYEKPEKTFMDFADWTRPGPQIYIEYLLKRKKGDYLDSIVKNLDTSETSAELILRRLERDGIVVSEESERKIGTKTIRKYKICPEVRKSYLKRKNEK